MILFPRDDPVIENLNSYYVDVQKVFEHYQGQMASGAVHFRAQTMEGVVFFDEVEPLRGVVETRNGSVHGTAAAETLIEAVSKINFTISVFEIPQEKIFLWAHLPDARQLYSNLSAEFTDLDGLVKKMTTEGLTGVIDVRGPDGDQTGAILFENGEVLDVFSPLIDPGIPANGDKLPALIAATCNGGASFSVRQILPEAASNADTSAPPGEDDAQREFPMLEELIDIFERAAASQKKDFANLFRRHCINNADRFDFLDPFVGEFSYTEKRIVFSGDEKEEMITRGLLAVLTELAEELQISAQVRYAMGRWAGRWQSRLNKFKIAV